MKRLSHCRWTLMQYIRCLWVKFLSLFFCSYKVSPTERRSFKKLLVLLKVQLLLNEYQDAPFLFQNLISLDRRNQQVKFKKKPSTSCISFVRNCIAHLYSARFRFIRLVFTSDIVGVVRALMTKSFLPIPFTTLSPMIQ